MKRLVRDLLGLSIGVFVLACSGGGGDSHVPDPGNGAPDDGKPAQKGLCRSAAPAVLEASGTLVLSGTFQPTGGTVDECIGDARAMAFAVTVPDDGSLEIRARTSFPASISVREDCEAPGRTALCNADVGRESAILPVSGTKEVFFTLSSLSADSVGKKFEVEVAFHPPRKSGESCDRGFLCEPGTFCHAGATGLCTDLLQIDDAHVFHDGAQGDERILSFGVSGPMDWSLGYELEVTDIQGATVVLPRSFIVGGDDEAFVLRQALSDWPSHLAMPHSARFRAFNGAWTDWKDVQVVQQPLLGEREACDPHAALNRCDVGLACAGPEEKALCLPTEEARIAQLERAPRVELNGSLEAPDARRITSTGRGVWEIPSSCEEALFVSLGSFHSLPEAAVRMSVGEEGATVGLMTNADIFLLLRNEGGQFETIACELGYALWEDFVLDEGEYVIVMQSASKRLAPAWNFGLSFFPPLPQ